MAEPYEALVQHVQDLEVELKTLKSKLRASEQQEEQQRTVAARRLSQLKTLQTLNLGIFASLQPAEIYEIACQTMVHQVGWDTALVVALSGGRGRILANYHATEKQLTHVGDYLSQNPLLTEAYAQRIVVSTYQSQDNQALALRSLFQAEEVIALPIVFGDQCHGYLVLCATTTANENSLNRHDAESMQFLAGMTSLLGNAVEQSANLNSLEEQNLKLRHLDELKDSFISITSHQLRTPLSIVKWILSILQGDPAIQALSEQHHIIAQAYDTNERLIHVVNDLLNVSRIQEGKLPHNPQPAELNSMVHELSANAEQICANHSIKLELTLAPEIPSLELDHILFKEALQNLIDNAIDYNLETNGWIKIETHRDEKQAFFTISNPGLGIPEEEKKKIFEQFYRTPQAVSTHPNGNGLGLYLARAIVVEHGGTIEMQSTPDATTFSISLPIPN